MAKNRKKKMNIKKEADLALIRSMSHNALIELHKSRRVVNGFNTGERPHDSERNYGKKDRAKNKVFSV